MAGKTVVLMPGTQRVLEKMGANIKKNVLFVIKISISHKMLKLYRKLELKEVLRLTKVLELQDGLYMMTIN